MPNAEEFVEIAGKQVRNREAYSGWAKLLEIVEDRGPNVQAAIQYLWQEIVDESPPCLGHTVQLVVNDSIDS